MMIHADRSERSESRAVANSETRKNAPATLSKAPAVPVIQRIKAGQLSDAHVEKWFLVQRGQAYPAAMGKYLRRDEAGFYWFRGKNTDDGTRYEFAVQDFMRVSLQPNFAGYGGAKGFGFELPGQEEQQDMDMVQKPASTGLQPPTGMRPPKTLVIDIGKGKDTTAKPVAEEELGLTDPYSFTGGNFFKALGIETENILLMVMDQINNWSLIKEGMINKQTSILMSAKALHMAHSETKDQLSGSNATILPITATDDVWDQKSEREWKDEHAHFHIKSFILHDKTTGDLINIWGSGNWTQSGLFKNTEFIIVDRRPEAAIADASAFDIYLEYLEHKNKLLAPCIQQVRSKLQAKIPNTFGQNTKGRDIFLAPEQASIKDKNILPYANALRNLVNFMIADNTMAIYTLPRLGLLGKELSSQSLNFDMVLLIKSILNTAQNIITIASMTMFSNDEKDQVLVKISELLKTKEKLRLNLLVDESGSEALLSSLDAVKLKYNVVSGKPGKQEKKADHRVEVYIFGNHEGDTRSHWSFHAKIMVIDDVAALLTSANFIFGGNRGGGGKALNKYYYTKNPDVVRLASQYVGGYMADNRKNSTEM
jgi:hypothetical protein